MYSTMRLLRYFLLTGQILISAVILNGQGNNNNGVAAEKETLKIWKIPNITSGAECYFSPDSKTLIYNGKEADDSEFRVYTINIDGTNRKKIESKGADACSYFNPNGERTDLDFHKG